VLGHLLQKAPEMSGWRGNGRMAAIYCVIYMFHMPTFAFFSGLFSSAKKTLLANVRETLVVYLLAQTCWCIYLYLLSFVGGPGPRLSEIFYALPGTGLWYLLSLFFWRVVTPLLVEVKAPKKTLLFLCAYGALLGLVGNVAEEFSLSRTIAFFPFFAAGFWSRQFSWPITRPGFTARDVFLFCLCAVLAPLVFREAYHESVGLLTLAEPFSIDTQPLKHVLFRAMLYVVAFTAIRWLCILIPSRPSFVTLLGQRSLSVFIGHFYLVAPFQLFLPDHFWLVHMIWLAPLLTIVCCAVFAKAPVGEDLRRVSDWICARLFRASAA
jgi:fucose 4-O-acetylase-like acetyltransferase